MAKVRLCGGPLDGTLYDWGKASRTTFPVMADMELYNFEEMILRWNGSFFEPDPSWFDMVTYELQDDGTAIWQNGPER